MKLYKNNPRKITEKQFSDLEKWLEELGDLGGIVHDLNSDQIVGGNQRTRIFRLIEGESKIELTEQHDPDDQGTVALGSVIWRGHKYSYRQVRWSEEQTAHANIVANRAGGTFDFDILANNFDVPLLLESGFTEKELQLEGFDFGGGQTKAPPEPDIDKAEELQAKWKVKTGDLYGLGKYTVCPKCGKVHNLP